MCDEIKPANDGNPSHRGTERSFQVRNCISYLLLQFKIQLPMVALNLKEKKSNISIQYAVSPSPCWKRPVESECLKNQVGVWTSMNIKAHFSHLGWLIKKEITLLCTWWDTQVLGADNSLPVFQKMVFPKSKNWADEDNGFAKVCKVCKAQCLSTESLTKEGANF